MCCKSSPPKSGAPRVWLTRPPPSGAEPRPTWPAGLSPQWTLTQAPHGIASGRAWDAGCPQPTTPEVSVAPSPSSQGAVRTPAHTPPSGQDGLGLDNVTRELVCFL